MYISVNYDLPEEIKEDIIRETRAAVEEALLKDGNYIRKLIRDAVKGCLSAQISELLQAKDYRDFLKEKIKKEIGMIE